jgi:hypothetical protein
MMFDKKDYLSFIPATISAAVLYLLHRARERLGYSPDKKHWYCFAFKGEEEGGRPCMGYSITGYPDKLITMPRIKENERYAGVKEGALLLAVSYLGHMTKEQVEKG